MIDYNTVLARINALPADWHGSGPLSDQVLEAIAGYCRAMGPVSYSVETGAGKSTLFFSQITGKHVVFAIDIGDSLSRVRQSPLCDMEHVKIVEGPTQQTLPNYTFSRQIQIALLDGPHGYPFPELEYYYIYPHLAPGALLIIDDINIPSIKNMAEILKKDDMFDHLETLGKTAFFRRNEAPLFDPLGDGWWEQGYNKPFARRSAQLAAIKKSMPTFLFDCIPQSLKLLLQKFL